MKLYLCEKPSQAKDIAPFVGARTRADGYFSGEGVTVTWCIGHLLEQASPEGYGEEYKRWSLDNLPISPDPWRMEVISRTASQYKIVKSLLQKSTVVVIATDADREGEVIAREVLDLVGFRGRIQRLWLSALDAASVKKGLSGLKSDQETRNIYMSGLGRARADWLTGMNMTRALTVAFGVGGPGSVLHCGRVQTPVLGLIVRRERAIAHFKPKTHYVLDAAFSIQGTATPMDWVAPEGVLDSQDHCVNIKRIQDLAAKVKNKAGRVTKVEAVGGKESAPLPYYLGAIQKEASKRFGMKAQAVLDCCQSLYEKHKATSYPRTDCEYLPQSMWGDVPNILNALVQVDVSLKPLVGLTKINQPTRCFNDSKLTGHHAIIPTGNSAVQLAAMTPQERSVYELIRRRFIAQFLGDHAFTKTTLTVQCEQETFRKVGRTTIEPGWKRAELAETSKASEKSTAADDAALTLPACRAGDQALNVRAECATRKTEPPKRYTEGTLITAMESVDKEIEDPRFAAVMKNKEKAGIGTDATRSSIIEGLFKREYIINEKKSIVPSQRGMQLIELLESIAPQVVDPVLTAHWEEQLSLVEKGELTLGEYEQLIGEWIRQLVDTIRSRKGQFQIQAGVKATAKAAKTSAATQSGTQAPGSQKAQEAGLACPACSQGVMRYRNGSRGAFWGCSRYGEGCKHTMDDQAGQPVAKSPGDTPRTNSAGGQNLAGQACPTCKEGKLELKNLPANGKQFWGCSRFTHGCRHFVWAK